MINERDGYDNLWTWFGCSRSSWLTMPRVMMHDMPDEWQKRMADLLDEWDETWDSSEMPDPSVVARSGGKYARFPEWLLNYRRPNLEMLKNLRRG